jgi:hypothetical protein
MVLAADNTKYAVHTTRNDDSSRERCITKQGTGEAWFVAEPQQGVSEGVAKDDRMNG